MIANSVPSAEAKGLADIPALHDAMRGHQRHCTEFALRAGRAGLFLDTGLGKTLCALDWGRVVAEHTGKPTLMLAPLGVVGQHVTEAKRFGLSARSVRSSDDIGPGVNITNYDRLHLFDARDFGGLSLDESSIIKSFTGATTRKLMQFGAGVPFLLACTATPAPNDHMELGQHSQFLRVMASNEMLTRWFIADQRNMGRYRLKKHAVRSFWSWVASWSRAAATPSDLGFSDDGYDLPKLVMKRHLVRADISTETGEDGSQLRLLRVPETSATAIHKEKRLTADARARVIADLVSSEHREPWIIWVDTDYEADAIKALLPGACEVRGNMAAEVKEAKLQAFSDGSERVLITKPSIAGFGLNWQHCARVGFMGLSFSYEQYYQAVRRCWRFGQSRPVHVHVAMADTEHAIWQVISRKQGDHGAMQEEMRAAMRRAVEHRTLKHNYEPAVEVHLPAWMTEAA